ncbi:hypothetical protein STXM2123_2246 [Streptomyces sp. F-3]|nr:hypothetical protein STXM2123_2246 [Streptomyces sp. F-3]
MRGGPGTREEGGLTRLFLRRREGRRRDGGDPGPSTTFLDRRGRSRAAVRRRGVPRAGGRSRQVRIQRWLLPPEQE